MKDLILPIILLVLVLLVLWFGFGTKERRREAVQEFKQEIEYLWSDEKPETIPYKESK